MMHLEHVGDLKVSHGLICRFQYLLICGPSVVQNVCSIAAQIPLSHERVFRGRIFML